MKQKNNKKGTALLNEEMIHKQIPDEVKVALGKFYIFSLIYIIFFGVIFPFYLIYNVSLVSQILVIILLMIFYVYMLVDVFKKKQKFTSTLFVFLIILVFFLISFSIVKMFI